ncbi:indolethylamine N-methyltransferase-like [Saccoglossus kowalevskii]|uniref:Indolethylamine N-methyltransferase-like n=1 Tax=Saccoglossus kowalevskii TaxID=10224 RepID=A0ABM0GL65_SACKO|nr:PREDICTED: indolethylamine N-methyltransferase-like [Saccoglossus kowalevskii]
MDPLLTGTDYNTQFNAKLYLEECYTTPEGNPEEEGVLPFMLDGLHQVFTEGGVSGDRLIDIGSGPCIYQFISACTKFNEIVTSDYVEENRIAIKQWLGNEVGAFDWQPIIQHVCEMEKRGDTTIARTNRIREVVKDVVRCDVLESNPLEPLTYPQFDCLLTCLCLEAACQTKDQYMNALRNITGLLKSGGTIVQICEPINYYSVGEKRFAGLMVDKEFVQSALKKVGFTDLKCHQRQRSAVNVKDISYEFTMIITAKKK